MLGDRSIAVIDDDEGSRSSIVALLRSSGLRAHAYASADSFLADEGTHWACVISDIQMPGTNGFDLLSTLRSCSGSPPVVLMTAYPIADVRRKALEAGAAYFFAKLTDGDVLISCLTSVLEDDL